MIHLALQFVVGYMNHLSRYIKSSPARLFVFSFLFLIFFGTFLLLLPFSTTEHISFVDALFTSTSAVCVTGLVVVDTSSCFTLFGKTIIMLLIQSGGIGVLTFASYFSYFFKGKSSYENQIALGDMSNTNKLGEVFKTVSYILIITLFIEFFGAVWIYLSLDVKLMPSLFDRIYFSVFHAVSAFCNAGFSTLPNGIMETGYITNYSFQLSLIFLLTLGGLGFPIVINILKYIKHLFSRLFGILISHEDVHQPWVMKLGSKVNLWMVFILIVGGTAFIFFNEYNNILLEHKGFGKFVTALFAATSPRTAGFNSINYDDLRLTSIIVVIFLMWIGASPASTGGGIKTSTFAVSVFNFISLVKGKSDIEVYNRRISEVTIRRAYATLMLSILVIGLGVLLIAHFDSNLRLLDIIFECFSAYSTVGLTLGITHDLSVASKLVLVTMMFIGRVTMLTILIGFFKKIRTNNYRYPSDEILIN